MARVYPYALCANVPLRNSQALNTLTLGLGCNVSDAEKKRRNLTHGVIGRSPLHELQGFDVIIDMPLDHLHLFGRGMAMRLLQIGFKVTKEARKAGTHKRLDLFIDDLLADTKVISEFSRRNRKFDFLNYKAEEFRNLYLSLFVPLLRSARSNDRLGTLVLQLVFIYRSYLMCDKIYFEEIDHEALDGVVHSFVRGWEALFGQNNCFYNLHIMLHLRATREVKGPLTRYSAYPYESSYGTHKANFRAGTRSLGKQAMMATFMNAWTRRGGHHCQKRLIIKTQEKDRSNDTIIATSAHEFLQVTHVTETEVTGFKINTYDFVPNLTGDRNAWRTIGVRNFGSVSDISVTVARSAIYGKGVLCANVLTSLSTEVLQDK